MNLSLSKGLLNKFFILSVTCATGKISSYPSNIQTRGLPPKAHLAEDLPDNAENFEGLAR